MNENAGHLLYFNAALFTKVVAVGAALLYLCGFLVVSMHLSRYGIHSVSLLRPQYLTAGFWSLCPLFLSCTVAGVVYAFLDKPRGDAGSGMSKLKRVFLSGVKLLWQVLMVFAAASAIVDGFASVFFPSVRNLLWTHWRVSLWLGWYSAMVGLSLLWLWRVVIRISPVDLEKDLRKLIPVGMAVIWFTFIFLVYIQSFTRRLYPEIPLAIGGGKPEKVVFLVKSG